MTRLKLGPLVDETPVKLTIELPAAVHRDLIAYADLLGRENGKDHRTRQDRRADARAVHGD